MELARDTRTLFKRLMGKEDQSYVSRGSNSITTKKTTNNNNKKKRYTSTSTGDSDSDHYQLSHHSVYRQLLVAPDFMLPSFVHLIHRERRNALAGKKASIHAKMNGLDEPEITHALYDASEAGVKIRYTSNIHYSIIINILIRFININFTIITNMQYC